MLNKMIAVAVLAGFASAPALAGPLNLPTTKPATAAQTGTVASLLTTLRSELQNPPIPSLRSLASLPKLSELPSLAKTPLVVMVKNDAGHFASLIKDGQPLAVLGGSGLTIEHYVGTVTGIVKAGGK